RSISPTPRPCVGCSPSPGTTWAAGWSFANGASFPLGGSAPLPGEGSARGRGDEGIRANLPTSAAPARGSNPWLPLKKSSPRGRLHRSAPFRGRFFLDSQGFEPLAGAGEVPKLAPMGDEGEGPGEAGSSQLGAGSGSSSPNFA